MLDSKVTQFVLTLAGILLCVFLPVVHGKVYDWKYESEPLHRIELGRGRGGPLAGDLMAGARRVRREAATGPGGGGGGGKSPAPDHDQLSVHITQLNDTNHNEAIVHWSGKNNSVVFVLTREHYANGTVPDSTLWRSSDYGSTFRRQPLPPGAVIRYYYSCPTNKSKLVFTDVRGHKLYVTHDEGRNLSAHPVPFAPEHLVFHPTNQDWILGYSYKDRKLYMTSTFGADWDIVGEYINSRFYWAVPGVDKDMTTIHMEVQDPVTGLYHYRACAVPYTGCQNDVTSHPNFGPIDVDSLVVQNEYVFVQRTSVFTSDLYVSYNRSVLRQAYFPFNVHPQDFSIVNTGEHQVFIAANHRGKTVNLYLSDTTGQFYVKSLERAVSLRRQGGGFDTDLYEVRGVGGTYIVNQHTSRNPRTMITFDQGGKWQPLAAPHLNRDKKPSNCKLVLCRFDYDCNLVIQPSCGLHLHLGFSHMVYRIPHVMSEDNAPGLILAHGTMGPELTTGNVSLFISSDAGYTWREQFSGQYIYNILDQGGAMVAVTDDQHQKTNKIWYSCTEGEKWLEYSFSNSEIQVDGVLNEPGITTLITSVYGHLDRQSGWIIAQVDFKSVLKRKCTSDDYELWDPTSDDSLCLLGQRKKYKHRKRLVECFNGQDYEKAINITICKCVADDYECDFGYEVQQDKSCKKASWFDASMPVGDCPEGSYYSRSKGYRKIAADRCQGGLDHDPTYIPTRVKCPLMAPNGLHLVTHDGRVTVRTGSEVNFNLTQDKGSKKSTEYIWSFGDRGGPVRLKGLNVSRAVTYTYHLRGLYSAVVTAKNIRGTARTTLLIHVEDAIRGVYIDNPHGAQVSHPVKFEAFPVSSNTTNISMTNLHYLWLFGDEGPNQRPMLTYEHQVSHLYSKGGKYVVSLETINSVSSIFKRFPVTVYTELTTLQLTYSPDVEPLNRQTAAWRRLFADLTKRTLSETLDIDRGRLEVVVLKGTPTRADVSVLPQPTYAKTPGDSIDTLVSRIIAKVRDNSLVINLDNTQFGDGKIYIRQAHVISSDPDRPRAKERDYTAVFVGIPILLVAVFVTVLVILYYKRKFSSLRRYSILHSHSSAVNEDDLMGEDDDDPPLDPDPDFTRHRGSAPGGTDDNHEPFGRQSTLVMMTGPPSENSSNSVTC